MSTTPASRLVEMVSRYEQDLLSEWVQEQQAAGTRRPELLADVDLHRDSRELLALLRRALSDGGTEDIETTAWEPVRDYLSDLSRSRAEAGFSPSETATFVFSLKRPLFARLAQEYGDDASGLVEVLWEATALLDRLGLFTIQEHQREREALINRQQRELMELSTPVVKLWEGVVALPLIGTLDSERAQVVMESLLERIVETNSTIAIIDITGVPTVDTLVAQHLLKTVAAARLMGADCVISGIRPQIAQTIVHLGLTLSEVTTKATMADAIAIALERGGLRIMPARDDSDARRRADTDPEDGRAVARHDPSGYARPPRDAPAGRSDGADRERSRARCADRHLLAGGGRLVHRTDAREHCGDGSDPRRGDGRRGNASGCRDHTGRAWPDASRCADGAQRRAGNAVAFARREREQWQLDGSRPSKGLDIATSDDVVRVRALVRDAAVELGFSIVDQTKVVTAASELARNTYTYGGGGRFRLEILTSDSRHGLRLVFEDDGPGIADIEQALRDGFTTGSGLGMGLGGARRLVNEFQIESTPGAGTKIVATRWR